MNQQVYLASELIEAIKSKPLDEHNPFVRIILPKPGAKSGSSNADYFNLEFNIGGDKSKGLYVLAKDLHPFPISEDEKDFKDMPNVRLYLNMQKSRSGDYGEFISLFSQLMHKKLDALIKTDDITPTSNERNFGIRTHYSAKHPDREKRKKPMEDPYLVIRTSDDKFSDKHPNQELKGRQKTLIFTKESFGKPMSQRTAVKGVPRGGGEPAIYSKETAHSIFCAGRTIDYGIVSVESLCVSKLSTGVAMTLLEGYVSDSGQIKGFDTARIIAKLGGAVPADSNNSNSTENNKDENGENENTGEEENAEDGEVYDYEPGAGSEEAPTAEVLNAKLADLGL